MTSSNTATILIIDDNAMNLDIAKDLLEDAGYKVFDAEDAIAGIQLMRLHHPDLVLLDLLMPQMDGFEAIRIMKADPALRDIPVLAFTAMASSADRNKALEYGCQDIITKPINPGQVIDAVRENLRTGGMTSPVPHSLIKSGSNYLLVSHPHKILIVDDNPLNVDILKEVLESMGQTVLCAYSGEEALALVRQESPDLVLLDIMMPKMNGHVVLEMLKSDPDTADIPVVIISALSRTEDRVKGLAQGALDYIVKPFEFEEVKARVSSILRNKELQDQLKQQRDDLAAANKELAEFATVASHDLQAPLRKISMFLERLERSNRSQLHEADADLLRRAQAATGNMQTLVTDLLTLSRAGYRGRKLKSVNLSALVQEVLDELEDIRSQTGAEIDVGELPVIVADEVQIRQLISNLLLNALKFRKPDQKPVIRVTGQPTEVRGIQLRVEDNGIGFDNMHKERIFKPFERLHGIDQCGGTGIGLAICKKVVERHGGSIAAESQPGQGATFMVNLPCNQIAE